MSSRSVVEAASFDAGSVPPPAGSTEFSLDLWDAVRSAAIEPRWGVLPPSSLEHRLEFLTGARLMGYELEPWDPERRMRELTDLGFAREEMMRRRAAGYRHQLLPQQLLIADAANSGRRRTVIEIVRRATKTTSLLFVALGRCASRPGYQVTYSAQSGVAGSRRLREWARALDDVNPPDDLHLPPWLRGQRGKPAAVRRHVALFGDELLGDLEAEKPTSGRGFKIMLGEVGKGIYWDNGSQLLVLKPDAGAYRGEAGDLSWLDEAQDLDPVEGDDLLAGVLPLQDTKLGAQIIVSGTAGEARVGPLWDFLSQLRAGSEAMGGVDYAIDPDTDWAEIADRASAMRLLEGIHPGIGTLTTRERMEENYDGMPDKPKWSREYLSLWPMTAGTNVIDLDEWRSRRVQRRLLALPARVAFGYAVKPRGGSGAIAAAWRDADGIAHVAVVAHEGGTAWMPRRMSEISAKHGASFAYDGGGDESATATAAERVRGRRPKLQRFGLVDREIGSIQFARDVEHGTLRHGGQRELDWAVEHADRRTARGSDPGRWVFTPMDNEDLTPLDACVMALRNWDKHYARRAMQPRRGVRTAA